MVADHVDCRRVRRLFRGLNADWPGESLNELELTVSNLEADSRMD
jgi:hypothetical protein